MKLLPLKAKIYQYTGLFLASKEQSDYIDSDKFWEQFKEYAEHPERDESYQDIYGIIIGSWQAGNGFYRVYSSRIFLRKDTVLNNTLIWLDRFYKQAKFDLKRIFSKGVDND